MSLVVPTDESEEAMRIQFSFNIRSADQSDGGLDFATGLTGRLIELIDDIESRGYFSTLGIEELMQSIARDANHCYRDFVKSRGGSYELQGDLHIALIEGGDPFAFINVVTGEYQLEQS